jgi:hypothetical protein
MAVKNAKITATKKRKTETTTSHAKNKIRCGFPYIFLLVDKKNGNLDPRNCRARSLFPPARSRHLDLQHATESRPIRLSSSPASHRLSDMGGETRCVCERRVHLGLNRAKKNKIIGVGSIRRKMDGGGIRPYFAHTY